MFKIYKDVYYAEILKSITKNIKAINKVKTEDQMKETVYEDTFVTKEQKKRDVQVTNLLKYYVENYKSKTQSNKIYKLALFILCSLIVVAGCIAFGYVFLNVDFNDGDANISNVLEIASVCITFLTLIVGLLKIITEYVFPNNEEEYISKIVEIIQKNDLENKKENIKHQDNIRKVVENAAVESDTVETHNDKTEMVSVINDEEDM